MSGWMQKGMKILSGNLGSLNVAVLTVYFYNILRKLSILLKSAHLFEIVSNKALKRNKVRRS